MGSMLKKATGDKTEEHELQKPGANTRMPECFPPTEREPRASRNG